MSGYTNIGINRYTKHTIGLRLLPNPDNPTNGLCHFNGIHVPHENNTFQLTHIDTLRQDRAMQDNKLFVRIFAPLVQCVEEYISIDFLTINNCTSLGSDIKVRITPLSELICKVCLKQCCQLFGSLDTYKDLFETHVINRGQYILCINQWSTCFYRVLIHINDLHLWWQDVTTIHKFRCRNPGNYLTISINPVHAWFVCYSRCFACSSEEESTICLLRQYISGLEEVTLNTVMCLIKVYCVNVNTRLYNAMKGVICGEDDNMLTHCVTHRHKQIDSVCLGSLEMFGITTVNMQHICIINMLKKVRAKLISKQQSRCHNNNGSGLFHLKAPHSILDLNQCLTTTSGEDALTQRMCAKGIDCCLLMRTKGDHQCVSL